MNFEPDPSDFDDELTDPGQPGARACVLVAEDDRDLRQLIASRMRREGFEVLEACSGDEAMAKLAATIKSADPSGSVDLLVMDVRMPGTSGLEIARLLRMARWSTPVLLITAYPDPSLLVEAAHLNAAVLAKPFALDRLSEAAISTLIPDPQRPRERS